jgi:predicted RNA binding protein YcfA (HicA-like mRNA interferase family)
MGCRVSFNFRNLLPSLTPHRYKGCVPNPFPSLKGRQMLRILGSLGYEEVRCRGSHRRLTADGRPPLTFAFHDGASLAPGVVRDILVKQAGLDFKEALRVVQGDD